MFSFSWHYCCQTKGRTSLFDRYCEFLTNQIFYRAQRVDVWRCPATEFCCGSQSHPAHRRRSADLQRRQAAHRELDIHGARNNDFVLRGIRFFSERLAVDLALVGSVAHIIIPSLCSHLSSFLYSICSSVRTVRMPQQSSCASWRRSRVFGWWRWVLCRFKSRWLWVAFVASQVELTAFELAGFLLSVGITTGGIGITVAHELFHKKSRLDTFSGKILLLMVCYMHFYIEHLMKKWRRRTPGMLTIASPITFCFVCSATPTTISIRCVLTRFCAISTRARNSRQATQA